MSQIARLLLSLRLRRPGPGAFVPGLPAGPAPRADAPHLCTSSGSAWRWGCPRRTPGPSRRTRCWPRTPTRSYTLERVVVAGVDGAGREWAVDPMAWSPLPSKKITDWIRTVYPRLGPAQQREAERFLLERAEAARRQALAGTTARKPPTAGPPGRSQLAAHRPAPPAPEPFVALRAYRIRWQAREVLADPDRVGARASLRHGPELTLRPPARVGRLSGSVPAVPWDRSPPEPFSARTRSGSSCPGRICRIW